MAGTPDLLHFLVIDISCQCHHKFRRLLLDELGVLSLLKQINIKRFQCQEIVDLDGFCLSEPSRSADALFPGLVVAVLVLGECGVNKDDMVHIL